MFTPLTDRSVIVTGGSRGIGRGIATMFARSGARVLLVGRDAQVGGAAASEVASATGAQVAFVSADVARWDDCERVAAEAVERFGGIDVLCANAGVFPQIPLADTTEEDLARVLGTNVTGTVLSVRACVPALAASGRGRVILTSSITGPITGYPGWSVYGASKAAQLGFMRTAAIELAAMGITVNAVLPGNVVTEGLEELGEDYQRTMAKVVPVGRLGTVEEVGAAALFLACDEAAFITGQAIVVDGGQVLPESPEALAAAST